MLTKKKQRGWWAVIKWLPVNRHHSCCTIFNHSYLNDDWSKIKVSTIWQMRFSPRRFISHRLSYQWTWVQWGSAVNQRKRPDSRRWAPLPDPLTASSTDVVQGWEGPEPRCHRIDLSRSWYSSSGNSKTCKWSVIRKYVELGLQQTLIFFFFLSSTSNSNI